MSCGPLNPGGKIFELDEDLKKELIRTRHNGTSAFRLEAGQHRLEAVSRLALDDHNGSWPAQLYLNRFTPDVLTYIRENQKDIRIQDEESNALGQLSSFFKDGRPKEELEAADRHFIDLKEMKLSDKVQTTLKKVYFGHACKQLIAHYPSAGTGFGNGNAAILNDSIHPSVRLAQIAQLSG